ncbi:hypothetical protein HYR69_08205, partial [Candidatus Sumerlaeota bacterium]|nr:hypothetical protein [Candidatus Sumerlaeota bacterium]
MVLLHSENLWRILDAWITSLANETFNDVLPLLRRTFSTFPAPERRMMGEQVKRLGSPAAVATRESDGEKINHERGGKTLPIILKILGIEGENE